MGRGGQCKKVATRYPEGRSGTLEYKGLRKGEKRPSQMRDPKRQGLDGPSERRRFTYKAL